MICTYCGGEFFREKIGLVRYCGMTCRMRAAQLAYLIRKKRYQEADMLMSAERRCALEIRMANIERKLAKHKDFEMAYSELLRAMREDMGARDLGAIADKASMA